MDDAKYKIPANWEETCDGQGCKCMAFSFVECGCPDADWTPSEVYELRAEVNALLEARDVYELWAEVNALLAERANGTQLTERKHNARYL